MLGKCRGDFAETRGSPPTLSHGNKYTGQKYDWGGCFARAQLGGVAGKGSQEGESIAFANGSSLGGNRAGSQSRELNVRGRQSHVEDATGLACVLFYCVLFLLVFYYWQHWRATKRLMGWEEACSLETSGCHSHEPELGWSRARGSEPGSDLS